MLKNFPNDYYVKICEKKCTFLEESTAGKAVCATPGVSTTYSNENFDIEKEKPALNSGVYFGSFKMEEVQKAFNGILTDRPEVKTAQCNFGMEFKKGYVAVLS